MQLRGSLLLRPTAIMRHCYNRIPHPKKSKQRRLQMRMVMPSLKESKQLRLQIRMKVSVGYECLLF